MTDIVNAKGSALYERYISFMMIGSQLAIQSKRVKNEPVSPAA
jgi:hypothetical protein